MMGLPVDILVGFKDTKGDLNLVGLSTPADSVMGVSAIFEGSSLEMFPPADCDPQQQSESEENYKGKGASDVVKAQCDIVWANIGDDRIMSD